MLSIIAGLIWGNPQNQTGLVEPDLVEPFSKYSCYTCSLANSQLQNPNPKVKQALYKAVYTRGTEKDIKSICPKCFLQNALPLYTVIDYIDYEEQEIT